MGRLMWIWVLAAILAAGCTVPTKEKFHPRYIKRASRETVFKESLKAVYHTTGGVDTVDETKGYIKSVRFPPPLRYRHLYRVPTRYFLEVKLAKHQEKDTVFYTPEFNLATIQSRDMGKTWVRIPPPQAYKEFIEDDLRKRVITIVAVLLHRLLSDDCYLGFVVLKNKVPLYASAKKDTIVSVAMKYQFGELQFGPRYKTKIMYGEHDDLIYVKLWTHTTVKEKGERKKIEGWVDENAINMFVFKIEGNPGNVETFKKMYRKEFLKGVSRSIGLKKGEEEGWPPEIIRAIATGRVLEGMTEEQVTGALGPPQETVVVPIGDSSEMKVYIYKDLIGRLQKRVHFIEGRMKKIGGD